jgi:glycosyltransferase involved in cell wall biosynthesis
MKKIFFVVSTLARAGPVQQLYALVRGLDRDLYEPVVTALSSFDGDAMNADFEALGVPVHTLGIDGASFWWRGPAIFRAHLAVVRPDLVHCSGIRADWLGRAVAGQFPVVSTAHNIAREDYRYRYGWLPGAIMTAVHVRCWSTMRAVIGVSDFVKRDMAKLYPSVRVVSVPNGVFAADATPQSGGHPPGESPPGGSCDFVCLDGFDVVKDTITVVRAFARYRHAGGTGTLALLGEGPSWQACSQAWETSAGKEHAGALVFAGRVRSVGDWLRGARVVVSASRSEGFHMGVAEGLCAGLVPAVSAIGVREEMLRGTGFEGYTFPVGDAEALATLMARAATVGSGERERSAAVCRERYAVGRMCAGYMQVYGEILG